MPSCRSHLGLVAILLALAPLAGCSKHSQEIARIGHQTVTLDQFESVARGNGAQYPGPGELAKSTLLGDLVKRALLIEDAHRRGFDTTAIARGFERHNQEEILTQTLAQRLAGGPFYVSDAEVERWYEWRKQEAHVLVIFVMRPEAANAARAELEAGQPFAEVANRFNRPGALPPGGDIGFRVPGDLIEPLDTELRLAPVGQVRGPFETPEGWFLIQVTARRPREAPAFDQQRSMLSEMLRQRKKRTVYARAIAELSAMYHVRLEPGAGQVLFQKFSAMRAPAASGFKDTPPPPTLSAREKTMALAHFDGGHGDPGVYTLADAFADLDRSDRQRPDLALVPAIEQWLDSQVIARVFLIEARRRHLEEEPGIATQIRERFLGYMVESIYTEAVASHVVSVSDQELREIYRRHAGQYFTLHSARVRWISVTDSADASSLAEHGGHTGSLAETVKLALPGRSVKVEESEIRFPSQSKLWQMLEPALMAMSPGDRRGPLQDSDGGRWVMVQLISKDQTDQDFDQLQPVFKKNLESEALEVKREGRFNAYADSLRRVVQPFEVHPERLKNLPWPIPPPGA